MAAHRLSRSRTPCAHCDFVSLWRKNGFRYVACRKCGLVRLDPFPDVEDLQKLYGDGYFEGRVSGGYADYRADESIHRRNARDRMDWIAAARPGPPGRLLDVGCAVGYTLDEARQLGWDVAGVEISRWAAGIARATLGLPVHASLEEARAVEVELFDVVSFFQVLEHMPDPFGALEQATALLRPGGVVLIETWDRASAIAHLMGRYWQQATPPSVLYLFDRGILAGALGRAGLHVERTYAVSKRVGIGFVLHLLADKHPRLFRPLLGAAKRLRLNERAIRYRLGDLVLLVARRPIPDPAGR